MKNGLAGYNSVFGYGKRDRISFYPKPIQIKSGAEGTKGQLIPSLPVPMPKKVL